MITQDSLFTSLDPSKSQLTKINTFTEQGKGIAITEPEADRPAPYAATFIICDSFVIIILYSIFNTVILSQVFTNA
jgi:hypothetical protein